MLVFAVALSPGTIVEALANSRIEPIQKKNTMTQTTATQPASEETADKNAIRPFHVKVPEEELNELRRRIKATKWPEREVVTDASQGVQLATMQKLTLYWANDYDWRKIEARLSALPQFLTEIDGLDIHFIHVRSKHENALPMIVGGTRHVCVPCVNCCVENSVHKLATTTIWPITLSSSRMTQPNGRLAVSVHHLLTSHHT